MPATSTPRTPEGKLIRHARKQSRLSIPAAAAAAGISAEHWGNVERGYRSISADEREDVTGTPDMIALMARTVSVTAQQLTAAGRPDAAQALPAPGAEQPADDDDPGRKAVIESVRTLYPGDAVAMAIMTQWHKSLEQRRRELAAVQRATMGAAEA